MMCPQSEDSDGNYVVGTTKIIYQEVEKKVFRTIFLGCPFFALIRLTADILRQQGTFQLFIVKI